MTPTWTDKPSASGWYWMRWRRKWARVWATDVVWCSANVPGEIRVMTWQRTIEFPHAMFYGPVEPPPGPEVKP